MRRRPEPPRTPAARRSTSRRAESTLAVPLQNTPPIVRFRRLYGRVEFERAGELETVQTFFSPGLNRPSIRRSLFGMGGGEAMAAEAVGHAMPDLIGGGAAAAAAPAPAAAAILAPAAAAEGDAGEAPRTPVRAPARLQIRTPDAPVARQNARDEGEARDVFDSPRAS